MKLSIGRRDLVMALIGLTDDSLADSLGGITRLQKYIYLLDREEGVSPTGDGFEFSAYKAGPYSSKLYDDLEFLENLGFVESEVTADASYLEAPEIEEIEALSFDQLLNGSSAEAGTSPSPEVFEERRFRLTPRGVAHLKTLLDRPELKPLAEGIRKVKTRYGGHSLSDLLYHVYTKFPEMTTESEIRNKVLRQGRRS